MNHGRLAALLAGCCLLVAGVSRAQGQWRVGPGITFDDKKSDLHLALVGYAQADLRAYAGWSVSDPLLRADDFEWRRVRPTLEGEWRRFSFEIGGDLVDAEEHLKNAYVELRLNKRLSVRAGNFKLPVSREFLTSVSKTDFVERSALAARLAPARDLGLMFTAEPSKKIEWQAGVFLGDGRVAAERADTTVASRLLLKPWSKIELGASFSLGDVSERVLVAGDQIIEPVPKGFRGAGPTGYSFFVRHHVNGTRRRMGFDVGYVSGPWAVRFEALEGREQRKGQAASPCEIQGDELVCDDLSDTWGRGYAVSSTWLITGEKKRATITPERPLWRGPGAVELGVRYEDLRFDDTGADTGFANPGNRARNALAVGERVVTAGLSWWPSKWLRVMGNCVIERYTNGLVAPELDRRGNYTTFLVRLQFQTPPADKPEKPAKTAKPKKMSRKDRAR
ncbi:MAG: OprO/OprP family phosphate-selective porin [Vicinamibacteria bacterium]|jgi:phosphate-selective porin|nr:OprO/OprP family phosphate-selective porin [Vicinamibacteria bacterium]